MKIPKKKIHFIGLLANTDSSILKVDLDHGFKIEEMSDRECVSLISTLEGLPYRQTFSKLNMGFHVLILQKRNSISLVTTLNVILK